MATYRKLLKNRAGDTIIPALAGTLTSSDIDFSTFAAATAQTRMSGTTNSIGSSWTNLNGSYVTPHTGFYFIRMVISGGSAGATAFQTNGRVRKGTTDIMAEDVWSIANYAGNNFTKINQSGVFWIAKGQTIRTSAKNTNATTSISHWTDIQPIFLLED